MGFTRASGFYSLITDEAGGVTSFTRSADNLTVVKNLACGASLGFTYGLDPLYFYKYVTNQREATPAGLS